MKKLSREEVKQRMQELMDPIDKQILMCDNETDMLMMACVMLQRTQEIYTSILGENGARLMFEDLF
jgi:hypothetical protein